MDNECIVVFTARSSHRILREGGSQAWALDPNRARKCSYLICVQNQNNPDRDFSDPSAAHGAVFMVGKISDVIPALDDPNEGRWKICISEYALHTVINAWKGWRNPVRYMTLEELGINLDDLTFYPVVVEQHNLGYNPCPASSEKAGGWIGRPSFNHQCQSWPGCILWCQPGID